MSDTLQFGGRRPRPPRWVWAIAGIAAAAALAGVVVGRGGSHGAATSSPSRSPATAPVPGSTAPATGSAARWPSAAGACGSAAFLPQIRLAPHYARVNATLLVGGTTLRQVSVGHAASRPLAGLPDRQGRLVTKLVAGPDADYAFVASRCSGYLRVYRIVAGVAHRLDTAAFDLLGGPHHAWAVSYPPHTVLTPLNGGRTVTLKNSTDPVADTVAGLVVVAYNRRAAPLTHRTCTLESTDLKTGRPRATFELPVGRVPVSDAVFSRDGTVAAFQLARARQDPRFTTGRPFPPADVVVLHLHTGSLDVVPGLELPPGAGAGLAFDATGSWLLATVSEGDRGELLAWRHGMPGPALVTSLPGPLMAAPPLLPPLSAWRNG